MASSLRAPPSPALSSWKRTPPSAYPSGLTPGPRDRSADPRDTTKRVSRTDMSFEQALQMDGTVVLREGPDIDSLGHSDPTTPSALASFVHPQPTAKANATTTTQTGGAPPTPTRPSGPGHERVPSGTHPATAATPSASTSSSIDLFYDAEDAEYNTRRRSLYRAPGTASSPDLATLVRKSKQRNGFLASALASPKDKRSEHQRPPPPPLPNTAGPASPPSKSRRRRPSTSTSATVSPALPPDSSGPSAAGASSPRSARKIDPKASASATVSSGSPLSQDWVMTSPTIASETGTFKNARASMRAKTSAFWGKVMGQGSMRDRSKSDANAPSPSFPFLTEFSLPPLPPLPSHSGTGTSTVRGRPSVEATITPSTHLSKPLPPIRLSPPPSPAKLYNDPPASVLESAPPFHRRSRSRSPEKTVRGRITAAAEKIPGHSKRRSTSVGEIDIRKALMESASAVPLPTGASAAARPPDRELLDAGIRGFLSNQLRELDAGPTSAPALDLRVPQTPPSRRVGPGGSGSGPARPRLHQTLSDEATLDDAVPRLPRQPVSAPATTLPTEHPIVIIGSPSSTEGSSEWSPALSSALSAEPAIVTPRTSSLNSPPLLRHSARRGASNPNPRHTHHPPSSAARSPNAFGSPLHMHSSRETNGRHWLQRPTAYNSEPSLVTGADDIQQSPLSALSQQDLTSNNPALRRISSSATSRSEDQSDADARGKDAAAKCWDEDESFIAKDKIAEWLGGLGPVKKAALRYYMDRFDFSGMRLDVAFRRFCAKLYLKAETQQVDRILEVFSRRYWECNPGSLFGNSSVVHAVAYSLLLLNTDLHIADLASKMSKTQFVRNTLMTIQMQLQPNQSVQGSSSDLTFEDAGSMRGSSDAGDTVKSRTKRSDSITSWNSVTRDMVISNLGQSLGGAASPTAGSSANLVKNNDSVVSVSATSHSESRTPTTLVSPIIYDRNWESDMESLLKDMYNAIKNQQVLQYVPEALGAQSLAHGGPLLRNRSLRVQQNDRLTTLKRGSIRGIQSILGNQSNNPYFNGGLDGRASPAPSFATSAHENLIGSTLSFVTPALGFASNLSHTIIREAREDDDWSANSDVSADTTISISDEELALLGPPWAKEGMLCRKQFNETTNKRAKNKTWLDVFVVIQKGELNMFTFGDNGGGGGGGGVVGGGNWLENAKSVGTIMLAHSLANALPPPGYNRQRPHCMVLTLANGAVFFFQAGTEELVNEWVQTCNYWAARLSKEPLAGGVSNMEYGWNRVIDPLLAAHARAASDDESVRAIDYSDSMSVRSGRSSRSRFGRRDGAQTMRGSPWGDRTFINEWKPPQPPTVASTQDEEGQLEALRKHVKALTQELSEHNDLRTPMMGLYPPRSANLVKSLANWKKKSRWLLTETVKYGLYVESLEKAMALRYKKRGEKALERALQRDAAEDAQGSGSSRLARLDEMTIAESDETTEAMRTAENVPRHLRESAEVEDESRARNGRR